MCAVPRESWPILTAEGDYLADVVLDESEADRLVTYWNTVRYALAEGDRTAVRVFTPVTIRDVRGRAYRLATDLDALHQFFAQLSDDERRPLQALFARPAEDVE